MRHAAVTSLRLLWVQRCIHVLGLLLFRLNVMCACWQVLAERSQTTTGETEQVAVRKAGGLGQFWRTVTLLFITSFSPEPLLLLLLLLLCSYSTFVPGIAAAVTATLAVSGRRQQRRQPVPQCLRRSPATRTFGRFSG